jgi:hypothetical protein
MLHHWRSDAPTQSRSCANASPRTGLDAPAADESTALAFLAKAEVLQEQDGVHGEGVIELDGVDVGRAELGHRVSGLPSGQRAGHCEVRHAGNVSVGDRLAAAQHVGGHLLE